MVGQLSHQNHSVVNIFVKTVLTTHYIINNKTGICEFAAIVVLHYKLLNVPDSKIC